MTVLFQRLDVQNATGFLVSKLVFRYSPNAPLILNYTERKRLKNAVKMLALMQSFLYNKSRGKVLVL